MARTWTVFVKYRAAEFSEAQWKTVRGVPDGQEEQALADLHEQILHTHPGRIVISSGANGTMTHDEED